MQEILDTHNHLWQYEDNDYFSWIEKGMDVLRRDFTIDFLEETLKKNNISGSILVQAIARLDESEALMRIANQNEIVRGVVGWCDIAGGESVVREQIKKLRTYGDKLKGIRYLSQGLPPEHLLTPDFVAGVREVGRSGLVYELLVTTEQLDAASELVEKVPGTSFVLEHIAKPSIKMHRMQPWAEKIQKLAKYPYVACKVSGMVTEDDWKNWKNEDFEPYLDVVYHAFGQERLMFGSDWPMLFVATDYKGVKGIVQSWLNHHPEIDAERFWGANAKRIYHLN